MQPVANLYGYTATGQEASSEPISQPLQKIYDVTKEGDNVNYDYVTLEPSAVYLVLRTAWTISTGVVYGHAAHFVVTPDETKFGTVAASQVAFGGVGTSGTTITFPTTTQIQWRTADAQRRVRLRVYKYN